MALDRPAAEAAIRDGVAKPLGLETLRAAWGIHDIVSEDVARAFRIHASERGFDYRSGSMVAFGGSGPLHALAIARKLKIPRVVFPVGAGVMSALGLADQPAGVRDGALAAHPCRRHRCGRFRRHVPRPGDAMRNRTC